jgi:hypothetical protein
MSELSVVHAGREEAAPFSNYLYRVLCGGQCVAEISHTYRGDEHFLRKPGGEWRPTDRLIEGGGPQPLELSDAGLKVIKDFIGA